MLSAEELRAQCAGQLAESPRGFGDCVWLHQAFLDVERERFVPDQVWWAYRGEDGRYPLLDRRLRPRAWLKAVYRPRAALITQFADGAVVPGAPVDRHEFTSSVSCAAVVVEMLRHLDLAPHHRVLEIGTGAGYTTALLASRTGADRVTTMEIDPALARDATARLRAAGVAVRVVSGDGEGGHPARAPYDRILSTAAVREIPAAWLKQIRPGGVILTPFDTPFGYDVLLKLVADGRGSAAGGPVAMVTFMKVRGQRSPRPYADLGWPAWETWHPHRVIIGPSGQHIQPAPPETESCDTASSPLPENGGRPRTDRSGGATAM